MESKNIVRAVVGLAVVSGALVWSTHWYQTGRWLESTDNAYLRADIAAITPRVAGEIIEVAVTDNQAVKKGDVLVRIDPRDYQARLNTSQARLAEIKAALVSNERAQAMRQAMVEEAQAAVASATAELQRSSKDFARAQQLVKDGVATEARLESATASNSAAQAGVARSQAGLVVAQRQVEATVAEHARLEAQVLAAQSAVELAKIDLEATTQRAPADGLVGNLSAHIGERVAPGRRLLSLVSGAVWVEANYKETQLTHVAVGQPAQVHVDAFPDQSIPAEVQSLAPASGAEFALLPPNNATGNFTKIVQRVPVKLTLKLAPEWVHKLRAGMSVESSINTKPGA